MPLNNEEVWIIYNDTGKFLGLAGNSAAFVRPPHTEHTIMAFILSYSYTTSVGEGSSMNCEHKLYWRLSFHMLASGSAKDQYDRTVMSDADHQLFGFNTSRQHFQNACRIWFCPAEQQTARELRELPREEREKVWADFCGDQRLTPAQQAAESSSEVLKERLQELDYELSLIRHKPAFEKAQQMAPHYINNQEFRVMFLRSTGFDVKAAANQVVQFLEMKKILFGEDKLGRDIALSDFSESDMDTMTSGGLQFLHARDRAGRRVYFIRQRYLKYNQRENVVSCFLVGRRETHQFCVKNLPL